MKKLWPPKFKGGLKRLTPTKLILILVGLLVVFALLNLAVFLSYKDKTYPNSELNSVHIGSVSKSELNKLIASNKFFPDKLTLTIGNKTYDTTSSSLGLSENETAVTSSLERDSWLPIANLWQSHKANIILSVNKARLSSALSQIAAKANVIPVGAKISLVSSKFTLTGANNGFNLDQTAAMNTLIKGVEANKSSLILPTKVATPSVTDASLQSQLKSLQDATNTTLTFTYNGRSASPSPSVIAGWYVASGNSYILSSSRIDSYIRSVGQTDGIGVSNVSGAASSIESSLNKASSLSFALQAVPNTSCSLNTLNQDIIVSVSARHLWACSGPNEVYDSAVVTGDEQHADTLTPVGTYHIYAKETNRTLTGSDENGSWSDFVSYWMPFLYNQYGAYGFHDATWRPADAFGNIDPNSANASNGCVELPLTTAQWIYNWASVGATVTIVS